MGAIGHETCLPLNVIGPATKRAPSTQTQKYFTGTIYAFMNTITNNLPHNVPKHRTLGVKTRVPFALADSRTPNNEASTLHVF